MITCLLLAMVEAGAAAHALNVPPFVTLQPAVEFVAGSFWAGAFSIGAYRLYRGAPDSIRAGGWLLVGFFGYTAARLFWFARADYDVGRLSFVLVLVIVMTVLLWTVDLRPAVQKRIQGTRTRHTENAS